MLTRLRHTLALVGLFALVAFLIPSHAEGGTIPTPSGTGAVCVVSGKVQPTACALGGTPTYVAPSTPAAATGVVRLPDAATDVVVGLSTATDYPFVQWAPAGSTTTFGNGSLYNQQNGYDFRVAASTGGNLYVGAGIATFLDSNSGVTADLGALSWPLLANFTTTANTATATNITWTVLAAEVWTLECNLTTQCSSTGGVKFSIGAPASSTVEGWLDSSTSAITTKSFQRFTAINTLNATATHTVATTPAPDRITARVVVGDPGSITLNAASNTAGQTTTIFAGSYCNARRAYTK